MKDICQNLKEKKIRFLYVATDFDGTLCEDNFTEIGKLREKCIEYVKRLAEEGSKIILYTCRENGTRKLLDEAVAFCQEWEIPIFAVNENPENEYPAQYGLTHDQGRKLYADLYLDDKAVNANEIASYDVDIILTKSMFKGYGWLKESNMTWEDYWKAFRKYNHALYITNVSHVIPQEHTELNYQFISTLDISDNEFRPADSPDGWDHSPYDDEREWLTKRTEAEYYNLCCDEEYRLNYFIKVLGIRGYDKSSRRYKLARILKKNPLFINESVCHDELKTKAEKILDDYSIGTILVEGDN